MMVKDEQNTTEPAAQKAPQEADAKPRPQVDLAAFATSGKSEWKTGGRSGCGLWIFVIIFVLVAALLGVGYVSLKQSVWVNLDKRSEHLLKRVPMELTEADRDALEARLKEFTGALKQRSDPYPAMGEFSRIASAVLADGRVSRRELEQLNRFLDKELSGGEDPN